jgi:sugar phosphate isomerase/epimerase
VAHGDLRWWDGDQTLNQLHWCAKHGFRATGLDVNQLAEPARRATILGLAKELDLRLHIGFHANWWKLSVPEIHAQGEAFLRTLDGYRGLDIPFISTDLGQTHRYDPQRPLAQQIDHLSACFAPLAKRLAERGTPLAVHNGFDFAGEDLAALCQCTPGLGLLYDTGTVMVVGVDPVLVFPDFFQSLGIPLDQTFCGLLHRGFHRLSHGKDHRPQFVQFMIDLSLHLPSPIRLSRTFL